MRKLSQLESKGPRGAAALMSSNLSSSANCSGGSDLGGVVLEASRKDVTIPWQVLGNSMSLCQLNVQPRRV